MKVYIVTYESFPHGMAATNRIINYAKALILSKTKCEVICYHRSEIFGKNIRNTVGRGVFEGIPFRYIGGTPLREKNLLLRKLKDYYDEYQTYKYLKKNLNRGDVLFLYMGSNVKLMLRLMRLAKICGAFSVRDLCELPYGTGAETHKALKNREITLKKQFPLLDGIIPISETLSDLAKTYINDKCKILKVPILVDFQKYELPDKSQDYGIPYIFHSGTLYEQKDGILNMIEAFGKVSKKIEMPMLFISTGHMEQSPHYIEIKKLIAKYQLEEKLIFTGFLSTEELKDKLSKASLVIINKYKTQQNHFCFSTKLGEYLAASKPLIITNVGEAVNWLTDRVNAIIIEPNDNDALVNAIMYAFTHKEEMKTIAKNGYEICQMSFDYRVWAKPLNDFMKSLGKDN